MIRKLIKKIKEMPTLNLLGTIGFLGILVPFIAIEISDLFLFSEDEILPDLIGFPVLVCSLFMPSLIGVVLISRKEIPLPFTIVKGLPVVILGYLIAFSFWGISLFVIITGLVRIFF